MVAVGVQAVLVSLPLILSKPALMFLCLCQTNLQKNLGLLQLILLCPLQISEPATHGNLRDYVLANQCSEVDRMLFLSQIAAAMKYLHCQHIVHGELRAENVAVVIRNGLEVKNSALSLKQ